MGYEMACGRVSPRVKAWIVRKARAENISQSAVISAILFEAMVRETVKAEADRIRTDPDALARITDRIEGGRDG